MKTILNMFKNASGYFTGRLSVGAFVKNGSVVLIDSGIDMETAKGIHSAMKNAQLELAAIINTHSHADHCGGNNYFQTQYKDLRIFATQWERAFIEQPDLEPVCFCGGAEPYKGLLNKHLRAEPSRVTDVIMDYKDQVVNIVGEGFKIVALPGHTPGMIGVITPDNIFYCGDAFYGEDTFSKHGILFYTNIKDTVNSLLKISKLQLDGCVFYHGGPQEDIKGVAEKHIERLHQTSNEIFRMICKKPMTIDELTQQVIKEYKIPENVMQFTLTRTCVNAYVTQLESEKRIELSVDDGVLRVKFLSEAESRLFDIAKHFNAISKAVTEEKVVPSDNPKIVKFERIPASVQKAAQSSRLWGLRAFGEFSIESKENQVILTIGYTKETKLQGEMHFDAAILTGVTLVVDSLKKKGFVENLETPLVSSEPFSYDRKLEFDENDLGKLPENLKPFSKIQAVRLAEDHFEISIESKDPEKLTKILSFYLKTLVSSQDSKAKLGKL